MSAPARFNGIGFCRRERATYGRSTPGTLSPALGYRRFNTRHERFNG